MWELIRGIAIGVCVLWAGYVIACDIFSEFGFFMGVLVVIGFFAVIK